MFITLVRALRVYQWSKNLLVFAALIFAHELTAQGQILRSVLAFIAFCAASSVMYLLNDLIDIENDRLHPEKSKRPLASGALRVSSAYILMIVLGSVSLGLGVSLGWRFLAILIGYLVLTVLYTFQLKNVVIIDVLVIALGFVMRAIAGAFALSVSFSHWLVVCTLFLALLLAISKRRYEMNFLSDAALHREVLGHYTISYLDSINMLVAGATLITYTIYTCATEVVTRLGTDELYLTLPFVVYGLFRYLYLVQNGFDGGDPSRTLLKDRPLGITVMLWGLACIAIIYGRTLL